MGWRGVSAALVGVLVLAGCGSPGAAGGPGADPASGQAQQVLARYEKAVPSGAPDVVGITSEPVSQVGQWESAVGGNDKIAVLTGHMRVASPVTAGAGPAVVRWASGRKLAVRTTTAQQAVSTLQKAGGGQSCDGCTPVVLSSPRLTRRTVATTTGSATVPVWSFAVSGSRVRITVVAVAAALVGPALPEISAPQGTFVSAEWARAPGPRTLEVGFTGALGSAGVPCGADYTVTAVESRHAVAVLVLAHPHSGWGACTAVGYARTATVQLTSPLAGRAVLDVVHGQAVPLK